MKYKSHIKKLLINIDIATFLNCLLADHWLFNGFTLESLLIKRDYSQLGVITADLVDYS